MEVTLRLLSPMGTMDRVEAAVQANAWSYGLAQQPPGRYKVWIEARDAGGNITLAGPYTLEVAEVPRLYLPLIGIEPSKTTGGPEG